MRNKYRHSAHHYAIMAAGALAYAQADRSDPFAYNRAMSHIDSGVAGFTHEKDGTRKDAFYKADASRENRVLPEGVTFSDGSNKFVVPTWINMQRP